MIKLHRNFLIGPGWSGTNIDDDWKSITSELYFDGQQVNLSAFGTVDVPDNFPPTRIWAVQIEGLTLGKHTLHTIVHLSQDLSDTGDGSTYLKGTYDNQYTLIVQQCPVDIPNSLQTTATPPPSDAQHSGGKFGYILSLSYDCGDRIDSVVPGSPFDKAGILQDDLIVAVENTLVNTDNTTSLSDGSLDLTILDGYAPGDTATLIIEHIGELKQVQVTAVAKLPPGAPKISR